MDILIYIIVAILLLYVFFMILPIVLPIILFIILALFIYILYMKHKIQKNMEQFDEDIDNFEQSGFDTYQSYDEHRSTNHEDIIDVEYTETEEKDDNGAW